MNTGMSVALAVCLGLAGTATLAQGNGNGQGLGGGMAHFFDEWDVNENGVVTLDDVAARRVELFTMFDLNGDGVIDPDEQANMTQTIAGQEENNRQGHGVNGPGPRIHAAMAPVFNDVDGDGRITAAEWDAATPRLFADLDRNGDGQINPMDFGRNG